ncbi:hypothetical protein [Gryllotalpicola protaetiae]|uniref:Core-binding (CB) domain-containing protein n=1 Tax=Gryllotalpicola protaetiae TaxID=2419771 RepID=A0A387BMI0_9MICO|nr:hypothetical protein [Gryllotalpicola protaetiae]AYG02409.1 hypothetical protein D7I44_01890 [Gryllotalpicola protaetiae]
MPPTVAQTARRWAEATLPDLPHNDKTKAVYARVARRYLEQGPFAAHPVSEATAADVAAYVGTLALAAPSRRQVMAVVRQVLGG